MEREGERKRERVGEIYREMGWGGEREKERQRERKKGLINSIKFSCQQRVDGEFPLGWNPPLQES